MRAVAPTLPLLIPGVGAQGGDAVATVKAARIGGGPIIINSSRAILYAGQGDDFAKARAKRPSPRAPRCRLRRRAEPGQVLAMQSKWLEDFLLLAQERSFTRAAELRHVTHPAFGRRIRALEAWAGTPLIESGAGRCGSRRPVKPFATPPSRWCARWPSLTTSCRPWPGARPM